MKHKAYENYVLLIHHIHHHFLEIVVGSHQGSNKGQKNYFKKILLHVRIITSLHIFMHHEYSLTLHMRGIEHVIWFVDAYLANILVT